MVGSHFFDSNVLLYLLSDDHVKCQVAGRLLEAGGCISVQVLNEIAHVTRRKMKFSVDESRDWIGTLRSLLKIFPVTEDTHDAGMALAVRHGLSTYDSMIVAAATIAKCHTVYSEDMQHGLRTERGVTIVNPFV